MKKQLYIYSILLSLLGASCEEVIEIDLNSSSPVLVAEGVLQTDSVTYFNLSYTKDYFTVEAAEKVSDAEVRITDNLGNVDTLISRGEGRYEAPRLRGQFGRTYTLSFTLDGQSYEASSTLMSPTKIMSVEYEPMEMGMREQIQGKSYYIPTVVIRDAPNEENFYNFVFYVDGDRQEGYFLSTDRGADEGALEYTSFRLAIEAGHEIVVQAYSIDEATYAFYSQLDDLSGDMMDSSTPYNPHSNFGSKVLGFFSAFSMDTYTSEITSEE